MACAWNVCCTWPERLELDCLDSPRRAQRGEGSGNAHDAIRIENAGNLSGPVLLRYPAPGGLGCTRNLDRNGNPALRLAG